MHPVVARGFRRQRYRSVLATAVLLPVAAGLLVAHAGPAEAAQLPIDLGSATSFAVLGGSTVTSSGESVVTGDLGTSPGTAVSGFPPGVITDGSIVSGSRSAAAQVDLAAAYDDATSRSPATAVSANLGGQTLLPGLYSHGVLGIAGTLTLDAQGDPDAVFILRSTSTLTTLASSQVVLTGAADPCNVFWQVGSSATLGVGSQFSGTVMAAASVTANTGATITGRLLAQDGAVTLDTNAVTRTTCPQPTTTTLTSSAASTRFGTAVTLTATVSPSAATGTVTFTDVPGGGAATALGSAAVGAGTAALTVSLPAFGPNSITASYSGDADDSASTSDPVSVEVSGYLGEFVVNEFRLSGPGGTGDSYVELYNTGAPAPLAGVTVVTGSGATTAIPSAAGTLGTNRSYLITGAAFSLSDRSTGDQAATLGSGGIKISTPDTAGTTSDAAGPGSSFHQGTGLPAMTGSPADQYAWRRLEVAGRPRNSGSNAADFALVSDTAGLVGGVQSALGTPAPTGSTDPYQQNAELPSALLSPTTAAAAAPNRVYVAGSPGGLVIRRTISNTSGVTISSATVRVTALSEANGPLLPGGPTTHAALRLVDPATSVTDVTVGGAPVTVHNLSLNFPGPTGGGLNSTLTVPLPEGGLAAGQSVAIAFSFAVDSGGSFWFGYDIDS